MSAYIFREDYFHSGKKVTKEALRSKFPNQLRDALLPKLMKGEIRVKDAEDFMEKLL